MGIGGASDAELSVRELRPADIAECERVLLGLPDWFGLEASNRAYIESLSRLPGAVAEVDGRIVGFAALEEHDPRSVELHVIAVQGIGTGRARAARWSSGPTAGAAPAACAGSTSRRAGPPRPTRATSVPGTSTSHVASSRSSRRSSSGDRRTRP